MNRAIFELLLEYIDASVDYALAKDSCDSGLLEKIAKDRIKEKIEKLLRKLPSDDYPE